VYPLAVLGSLCIAIAAFTSQTYPDTQQYAITAASLFLIAFTLSLIVKIIQGSFVAVLSYISTALAIAFLFIVIATFTQSIPMVSKSVSSLSTFLTIFMFSLLGYFFYSYRKKTDSKRIRLSCVIGLPVTAFIICYYSLIAIANFMNFTIPSFILYLASSVLVVFFIILLIVLVSDIRNRRARKHSPT
jgi:hypothetical protein